MKNSDLAPRLQKTGDDSMKNTRFFYLKSKKYRSYFRNEDQDKQELGI
jgi:hypothetical protein